MFIHGQWAILAALVYFAAVYIEAVPVGDDKADELRMAMNIDDDIKPNTETPNEDEPMQEPLKPIELDMNHIQVIKMPSPDECKDIIEELEEEIKKEKEIETEIKQEEEQSEMKLPETNEQAKQEETKEEQKMEQPLMTDQVVELTQDSPIESDSEVIMKPTMERSPRNMQMVKTNQKENETPAATSSLNDDDIDKIIKMISFPKTDNNTMKSEKSDDKKIENGVEPRMTVVESAEAKPRVGRAIRGEGKEYYILAFAPIEGPLVPTTYSKFDIIPIERSLDDDSYVKDVDEEKDNFSARDSDIEGEARLLSRKQFNKYIRKMMRQIRKGTRKIQRKTHLKSAIEEEPTVENFVRKWYETNKKSKAAAAASKSSWFNWGQT